MQPLFDFKFDCRYLHDVEDQYGETTFYHKSHKDKSGDLKHVKLNVVPNRNRRQIFGHKTCSYGQGMFRV